MFNSLQAKEHFKILGRGFVRIAEQLIVGSIVVVLGGIVICIVITAVCSLPWIIHMVRPELLPIEEKGSVAVLGPWGVAADVLLVLLYAYEVGRTQNKDGNK